MQVVFDGQSHNVIPSPNPYPARLMSGRLIPWTVPALPGLSWSTLATTAAARLFPLLRNSTRVVLVMNGGTSDFLVDHDSAAVALADMQAYADAARAAAPWSTLKIIAATLAPSTALDVDGQAQRLLLNPMILASAHWDAVVDLANTVHLTNASDPTYYSDGTHWTAAGAQVAADAFAPVLDAILAAL